MSYTSKHKKLSILSIILKENAGQNFISELDSENIKIPKEYVKDELNQTIWTGDELNEDIRKKLLEIADEYLKYLKLDIKPESVKFVGSMANYNWSDKSDLDVHLIFDFSKINKDLDFVKEYLDTKEKLWKDKHNIKVKGFDVELYSQDKDENFHSEAIFDLNKNEWDSKPKKENVSIDKNLLVKKIVSIGNEIEHLESLSKKEDSKAIYNKAKKLKDKIKNMRQAGLDKSGEFSIENLAFKYLRNEGFIERLFNLMGESYDEELSLKEQNMENPKELSFDELRIRKVAKKAAIDISKYNMNELIMGFDVEKEHGSVNPETNVTNDDEVKTLKIALAHLNENPIYYSKLKKYVENSVNETYNPWAVCTSKVGRDDKEKYEKCVMGVKEKQGMKEEELEEKSDSKSQQRLMGQVYGIKSGELKPSDLNPEYKDKILKIADSISLKDAKDFAETKHKGIPEKVNESKSNVVKHKLIIKSSVDNIDENKKKLVMEFIIYCCKELNIDKTCTVYLTGERGGPITTTASYNPNNDEIWIYTKNRNMLADPLRSLAHEIRHFRQNIDGEIDDTSGEDGSQQENEAHEFSGLMIRKFGKKRPEIFK